MNYDDQYKVVNKEEIFIAAEAISKIYLEDQDGEPLNIKYINFEAITEASWRHRYEDIPTTEIILTKKISQKFGKLLPSITIHFCLENIIYKNTNIIAL